MEIKFKQIEDLSKKVKPFIAVGILILLVFTVIGLHHYTSVYKQLNEKGYFKQGKATCFCNNNLQDYNPNTTEIENPLKLNKSLVTTLK